MTVIMAVIVIAAAATAAATATTTVAVLAVMATATATATATAAAAARGFGEIIGSGDSAEFEGHADVFGDLFAEGFQGALSIHELTGDSVFKQRVASLFKGLDLLRAKLKAGVLLLMEILPHLMGAFVLGTGRVIIQKLFDARLKLQERWVSGDCGAEFLGFEEDGGVVGKQCHAPCISMEYTSGNGHLSKIQPIARKLFRVFCYSVFCIRRGFPQGAGSSRDQSPRGCRSWQRRRGF